jgi:hypothetical protein
VLRQAARHSLRRLALWHALPRHRLQLALLLVVLVVVAVVGRQLLIVEECDQHVPHTARHRRRAMSELTAAAQAAAHLRGVDLVERRREGGPTPIKGVAGVEQYDAIEQRAISVHLDPRLRRPLQHRLLSLARSGACRSLRLVLGYMKASRTHSGLALYQDFFFFPLRIFS